MKFTAPTLQKIMNDAAFKLIDDGPLTFRLIHPKTKKEIKIKRYQRVACLSHKITGDSIEFTSVDFPFSYNRPVNASIFSGEIEIGQAYLSGITVGTIVKIDLTLG